MREVQTLRTFSPSLTSSIVVWSGCHCWIVGFRKLQTCQTQAPQSRCWKKGVGGGDFRRCSTILPAVRMKHTDFFTFSLITYWEHYWHWTLPLDVMESRHCATIKNVAVFVTDAPTVQAAATVIHCHQGTYTCQSCEAERALCVSFSRILKSSFS